MAARLKPQPRDLLAAPRDLGRWLVAARLAEQAPRVSRIELDQARGLREAIYRLSVARARRRALAEADRAVLNRWAAQPPPPVALGQEGLRQPIAGTRQLLALLARAAVELLGGPDAHRVRACSGEGCSLLFLDTSRAGQRRWCSMTACGNRAKVARFREGASA